MQADLWVKMTSSVAAVELEVGGVSPTRIILKLYILGMTWLITDLTADTV